MVTPGTAFLKDRFLYHPVVTFVRFRLMTASGFQKKDVLFMKPETRSCLGPHGRVLSVARHIFTGVLISVLFHASALADSLDDVIETCARKRTNLLEY